MAEQCLLCGRDISPAAAIRVEAGLMCRTCFQRRERFNLARRYILGSMLVAVAGWLLSMFSNPFHLFSVLSLLGAANLLRYYLTRDRVVVDARRSLGLAPAILGGLVLILAIYGIVRPALP